MKVNTQVTTPLHFGSYRVRRGGSWAFNANYARAGYRYNDGPGYRRSFIGFRLASNLKQHHRQGNLRKVVTQNPRRQMNRKEEAQNAMATAGWKYGWVGALECQGLVVQTRTQDTYLQVDVAFSKPGQHPCATLAVATALDWVHAYLGAMRAAIYAPGAEDCREAIRKAIGELESLI